MQITKRPFTNARLRTTKLAMMFYIEELEAYIVELELQRNQLLLNAAVDGSLNRSMREERLPPLPLGRSRG